MIHDEPRLPSLTVRPVYEDPPDLIEVEAQVVSGYWSGTARAYASPASLLESARGLLAWTECPSGEFALEAGADTGIGWLCLRWYPVDRAGHLACHVKLATPAVGRRPEEVWRLTLEMPTETGLVERFARHLVSLAETFNGEAVLEGV
jgi:hypothetical protein